MSERIRGSYDDRGKADAWRTTSLLTTIDNGMKLYLNGRFSAERNSINKPLC